MTDIDKKILDVVMKYALVYKEFWGCKEFVSQNDGAQVDAISLFSKIISILPEEEHNDE